MNTLLIILMLFLGSIALLMILIAIWAVIEDMTNDS
jgi:hypothetical protein